MADPLAGLHAQATRLILSLRDGLERLESVEVKQRGDSSSRPHPVLLPSYTTTAALPNPCAGRAQARRLCSDLTGPAPEAEGAAGGRGLEGAGLHGARSHATPTQRLARLCHHCATQRTSQELDSTWRLQVVRQNNAKRDVWKRCVQRAAGLEGGSLPAWACSAMPCCPRRVGRMDASQHAQGSPSGHQW